MLAVAICSCPFLESEAVFHGFDLRFCCDAQVCATGCQLSRLSRAMSSRLI
jgi:hypothetical protein